ncbi:MAG: aspartate--tRNA(Asn) ligase [Candidatus Aenigmatarchaeota archaeon]
MLCEKMLKRTHYTSELKKNIGKEVIVSGWCHDVRLIGGINFLLLRDREGIVQVTAPRKKVPEKILEIYKSLHQEDVLSVKGKVVRSKIAKEGIEIIPSEIEVISKAQAPLPLDPRNVTPATLETRLEWRSLDLRRRENQAIFIIQAKLQEGMEEFLKKEGFLRVWTPSIIGGISEGGAEVFKIDFFGKEAFLRQDPQLHRQLLIAAGFEKIYDLGPSWRAEPSDQPTHLAEHRTIAPEFAFMKDESDMIKLEERLCVAGIKKVVEECEKELKILNKEIEVPKLPFPELRFPKIYEILEEYGRKLPRNQDLDKESTKILTDYVKEKYKADFFFVNRFPFSIKPFYVMRVDEEPEWARSVDLIFKGLELSSGGQREHRYEKIIAQIKEKGLNLENLRWFTEVFRYGVPPHGGFSLGIERLTMKLLDMKNIKEVVLFPRYVTRMLP